jgi:hypothetical protein
MLKQLMEQGVFSEQSIRSEMETYGEKLKSEDYISACAILHKDFLNSPSDKKNFSNIEFMNPEVQQLRQVKRAFSFAQRLQKLPFEREMSNLIAYGIRRYEDSYQNHDEDNLVLYQKYSRKDVCRLLNWEHDDSSTMYGYRIKYNTCPIFVTYEKEENITNSTKYEDRFMNDRVFSWMTRSKVSIESQESQQLIHHKETGLKIYLFIKKNDGEGTDFYYMGKATPMAWEQTTIENDDGRQLPIMNFQLYLQHAVRSDIYEYFTK